MKIILEVDDNEIDIDEQKVLMLYFKLLEKELKEKCSLVKVSYELNDPELSSMFSG